MSQRPSSLLFDFTGRVLRHEAEKTADAANVALAFQSVCRALHARLAPLISEHGFHVLLARAATLASRDFALPPDLKISADSDCALSGLAADNLHSISKELADGLSAIFAHFIWLLIEFIGANLGLGTICELWPEVPFDNRDSSSGAEHGR